MDVWICEIENGGFDVIVVMMFGCGMVIKDYGFLFCNDNVYV